MEKKATFRDALHDYVSRELRHNFDSLNDVQRSRFFAKFYVKKVLGVISPVLVPSEDDELERAITDGKGDSCVDFLYRNDGRVLIIQAKYRKKKTDEPKGEFERFCSTVDRLYRLQGRRSPNRMLEEALPEIDWANDQFELHYITLGRATQESRDRQTQNQTPIEELADIEDRTNITLYDESDLNQAWRDALNYEEGISEDIEVPLVASADEPAWLTYQNRSGRKCFIGRIAAAQVNNLITRYRTRLFSLNIRNFLGELSTNKKIIETAMQQPEDFFFFNNGMSAVATKVEPVPGAHALRCSRFSIINGSQTANSLRRAYCRDKARNAQNAHILIRISEISYADDVAEGGFLDCITKYNNTQNAIRISDFRSNDPVQLDLKRLFGSLSLSGKKYWYRNKRVSEPRKNCIPIGMEEFAKTIHAFMWGPIDYFGGTKYLFDTAPGEGYVRVFGDGQTVWERILRDDFEKLAGTWFLCCEALQCFGPEKERRIEKDRQSIERGLIKEPVAKSALERKHLVFFTIGEFLRQKYQQKPEELERTLIRLGDPKWMVQGDKRKEDIDRYTKAACEALVRVYAGESRQPGFMHRNWFRSKEYLRKIEYEVSISESAMEALPHL